MKILNQNKIESIRAALIHYDGCEFDLRLTKDNVLILFHDAWYKQRRIIETNFKDLKNIQSFEQLINDLEVEKLVNDSNKMLWIEAKEDYNVNNKKTELYNKQIGDRILKQLHKSRLNLKNIYIISFNASILKNLKDVNKLLIVPYYDCSSDGKFARKKRRISFKKLLVYLRMFRSIKHHIQKAKELGLNGLLFPKQYFRGFFSIFQPSLENILNFVGKDFILGTDADTFEEEQYFKDLVVITNYNGKRNSNYRKKPLIFHGGLEMENAERMAPSA